MVPPQPPGGLKGRPASYLSIADNENHTACSPPTGDNGTYRGDRSEVD